MNKNAKILFCDIEATNLDANFGYILCIGYKWAHENKSKVISITDFASHKNNPTSDKQVLEAFRSVIESADIVVWHYGERFDLPYLQTRLLMNKMPIYTTAASVDTWRIAKYKMKLNSNRLETLLNALDCKHKKSPVDGRHWVSAAAGNKDAIKYIVDHCNSDILVLEEVYHKIKGLMTNHPIVSMKDGKSYSLKDDCPTCGEKKLKVYGSTLTATYRYQRLKCLGCGRTIKGRIYNARESV